MTAEERRTCVVALYREGKTYREIGEEIGRSGERVRQILLQAREPLRVPLCDQIQMLRLEGKREEEISSSLGISIEKVRHHLMILHMPTDNSLAWRVNREKVLEEAAKGKGPTQIARECDLPPGTVKMTTRRAGYRYRNPRLPQVRVEEIRPEVEKILAQPDPPSLSELGRRFGVSYQVIGNIRKRMKSKNA